MDRDTIVLLVALVLMLASYPLTAIGTDQQAAPVWVAGLVAVGIGALIPPVTRYLPDQGDADNDNTTADDDAIELD
jgi:hypothetical protein